MADIGIMGGTFNPIHYAHLLIAQSAYEQLKLDKVLFITGGNPPHKDGQPIVDAKLREQMVESAISENPGFEVCSYETDKQEYSYTAETLEYLKKTNPQDNFFFIIGADSLAYLERWYKPEKIAELATIAVYERDGFDTFALAHRIIEFINAKVVIIDAPQFDISSSLIRQKIREGKSVKYMVPDAVIEIIEDKRLYRND